MALPDPDINRFSSRKLWVAIGTGISIIACWLATGWVNPLAPTFDTLVGGLLAVAAIYLTGNVASRWVTSRDAAAPLMTAKTTAAAVEVNVAAPT